MTEDSSALIKLMKMVESNFEESSLIQHTDGFPVSRDWERIECKSKSCMWNVEGECTTPSKAIIGDGGKCEGFKAKMSETKRDGRRVLDI